MNPAQLHELVKDIPEVIPDCLYWCDSPKHRPQDWEWAWSIQGACEDPNLEHVADLICGQAKRMMKPLSVRCWTPGRFKVYAVGGIAEGPTELEAVLAAYRASRGAKCS